MSTAYEDVYALAQQLSRSEQELLVEKLRSLLSPTPDQHPSLLELQGVGKELWASVDAQEYVNGERASWTG